MKTTIFLYSCALAVVGLGWSTLGATEPVALPGKGTVLVLENERTLEGDIDQVGDQYRIRRSVGETWVPGNKVLRLCKDVKEAYAFLRNRANLQDPDERLRLAEWCHVHELIPEALHEVKAAVELRPEHRETRRLLNKLEQHLATSQPSKAILASAATDPLPMPPAIETLGQFNTRVQPILMNACAQCHSPIHAGSFKLGRVYEVGPGSRRTSLQNLAMVLNQVNPEKPAVSPLLTKAVTVHGGMAQPAFKSRQAPAFRALEEWVQATIETTPELHERAAVGLASLPGYEATHVVESKSAAAAPSKMEFAAIQAPLAPSVNAAPAATRPVAPVSTATVANQPQTSLGPTAAPLQPVDEFDPALFNRQMHPQK